MESNDLVLAYNGALYNYLELRAELRRLGHLFRTTSDTEVMLKAWRQWGSAALDRFEGMWAFALYDKGSQTLYLCRDRFGEKPLLLLEDGAEGLYFASEVRSLIAMSQTTPSVCASHLRRYLKNGFRALYKSHETYFEGVWDLPPATQLTIAADGTRKTDRYWTPRYAPRPMSQQEAVEGMRVRLEDSVEKRLRADVPLTLCLSGGIDSGVLLGIVARKFNRSVSTYSVVDSDPRFDERAQISATATHVGARARLHELDHAGFLQRLERLTRHRGEPLQTISYFVHAYLSEAIANDGYKVAMSGTGADEIFTGYYDHYNFWLAEMQQRDHFSDLVQQWRRGIGMFVRNPILQDPCVFVKDPGRRDHVYPGHSQFDGVLVEPFDEPFIETAFCVAPLRNRMLNELTAEVIPVALHEDDMNSMMFSIENRSPYLDRHLVEFMYTVPSEHLMRDGHTKWLLREVARDLIPEAVRLNHEKKAFNASIDTLIDRREPNVRAFFLDPGAIHDLVRRDFLESLLDCPELDTDQTKILFAVATVRMFLDHVAAGG